MFLFITEIPSFTHDNNNNNTTEQKTSTQSTVSSSNLPKHSKHPQNMSAVIKLDYDTSDPIYTTIRQLILKFLLKWIMSGTVHADNIIVLIITLLYLCSVPTLV